MRPQVLHQDTNVKRESLCFSRTCMAVKLNIIQMKIDITSSPQVYACCFCQIRTCKCVCANCSHCSTDEVTLRRYKKMKIIVSAHFSKRPTKFTELATNIINLSSQTAVSISSKEYHTLIINPYYTGQHERTAADSWL